MIQCSKCLSFIRCEECKETIDIYQLMATDLSQLGGSMGTEHTSILFIKFYSSEQAAKKAASDHYKGSTRYPRKFRWIIKKYRDTDDTALWSGDLGHVEYNIQPIKVEH